MIGANDDKKYTDRYLLFKRQTDIKSYLAHEIGPAARFNACDYIDYTTSNSEPNGVSHLSTDTLSIETNAYIDFIEGDWLYDVKGEKTWRITNIRVADEGSQKRLRMRPKKVTYLTLIGRV